MTDDGTIWVPAQHYRPEAAGFPALQPWYYEDVVLEVSPEGEIRREISVLKALADNRGLFAITYSEDHTITTQDPLHLNNVEPLPAGMAAAFPMFRPGDLLVSLRNINTHRGHRPGHRAGEVDHDRPVRPPARFGLPAERPSHGLRQLGRPARLRRQPRSRIDPATRSVVWQYDGCGTRPFFGETRGEQEVLANGNVLTFEPQGGRVLEITHEAKPEIVWEYFNVLDPAAGGKRVGLITHAERFPPGSLTFLTPTSS